MRPTAHRGLAAAAMAALLVVVPSVAEGGRAPTASRIAGGHSIPTTVSATGSTADVAASSPTRSGGHSLSISPEAPARIATDTHSAATSRPSSAIGTTGQPGAGTPAQGGHQSGFVLQASQSRLRSSEQALWPLEMRRGTAMNGSPLASTSNQDAIAGHGASQGGNTVLPGTSATSDQYTGSGRARTTLPVVSVTIGRQQKAYRFGDKIDGAGLGPLGGTVDVTVGSPDATPPTAPLTSPLLGPVSDVAIDLSGLFTTQFDGSLFATANCNMAAGAMLFEVQTGLNVTGGQMRAWSGATSQGTSLEDLQRAFASQGQALPIQRYLSWSEFQRQVASGRSAVVQGWYGYLPERYVLQPGFADGHSVFVLGYSAHVFRGRGGFYVMDPLGRAGYSGAWWPSDVLRAYGWSGKPGHAGEGSKLSYLGFVALQAHPSAKKPMSPAGRPAFQNYWQTTKDALEAALTVIIMSGHGSNLPAIRGVVLFIRDPRLNLTAAKAQQSNALGWPVAGKVTILRGFSARHPDLALAPGPHSRVLAAAAGRIIFESRRNATGTVTLWIEHGPDLFTVYSGLGHVDVKPGEWVSKGGLLGSLGTSRAALLFSISVGALPTSTSGHVNPARFLSLS